MNNGETVLMTKDGDIRKENMFLAFKIFFRELRKLDSIKIDELLKRWNIEEVEAGNILSLGIDFPEDVKRFQWFIGEDGNSVLKYVDNSAIDKDIK